MVKTYVIDPGPDDKLNPIYVNNVNAVYITAIHTGTHIMQYENLSPPFTIFLYINRTPRIKE